MPKKILLADDSLTIQKVVELTFSDSDFDLVCVGNGTRALDRVREVRPDLILADVVMPEKNGYEVCEAIKGDPVTAHIPVVLLTGTFEPFDRARAERVGADAIVSKPFDSHQLIRQVEALLARHAPEAPAAAFEPPRERRAEEESEPFDVGFAPEDFAGSIRVPFGHEQGDPFEEEYGRGDADSAGEALGRTGADGAFHSTSRAERLDAVPAEPETFRESAWLEDEPADLGAPEPSHVGEDTLWAGTASDAASSRRFPSGGSEARADEGPTLEIVRDRFDLSVAPESAESGFEDISEEDAQVLFDVPAPGEPPEPPREDAAFENRGEVVDPPIEVHRREDAPAESEREFRPELESEPIPAEPPRAESVAHEPHELEALAHTSSIPELAQMLSSVSRTSGGDLSDAEIDRLAARVVEKLSDRILREIAWEVIPDMAEIVIKQRIKELESSIE